MMAPRRLWRAYLLGLIVTCISWQDGVDGVAGPTAPVDRSVRPRRSLAASGRLLTAAATAADGAACADHSEVSETTIIRTTDSRALGAKFLNESSLGPDSRDRCLAMCCAFRGCNVAVYEEKEGGNCYLFDCGPADDFRCKFTVHSHYTSAVIRDTSHEEELMHLKKNAGLAAAAAADPAPTPTAATPPSTTQSDKRRCSRFQFECHTTGECIAIYNACDGIPQCADGSDEAPELGCPAPSTEATTTTVAAAAAAMTPASARRAMALVNQNRSSSSSSFSSSSSSSSSSFYGNDVGARANRDRFAEPVSVGERAGAGDDQPAPPPPPRWPHSDSLYRPPINDWRPIYDPPPNPEPPSRYYANEDRRYGSAWSNRNPSSNPMVAADPYADRYYNQDKERPVVYADGDNYRLPAAPPMHFEMEPILNGRSKYNHYGPYGRDPVYADVATLAPPPPPPPPPPPLPPRRPAVNEAPTSTTAAPTSTAATTPTSTTAAAPTNAVPPTKPAAAAGGATAATTPPLTKTASLLTNEAAPGVGHAHVHRFHVNQAEFQQEKAVRTRETVGAAWALTLGLSVTAVLVLVVGFRLRSLKRHLRGRIRNGGVARDADYLVNGMYL